MKKKVVPKLRQDVKVKVDIVTSDDIKIYCTRKFQDFNIRYIVKHFVLHAESHSLVGSVQDLRTGGRWFDPWLAQ